MLFSVNEKFILSTYDYEKKTIQHAKQMLSCKKIYIVKNVNVPATKTFQDFWIKKNLLNMKSKV